MKKFLSTAGLALVVLSVSFPSAVRRVYVQVDESATTTGADFVAPAFFRQPDHPALQYKA